MQYIDQLIKNEILNYDIKSYVDTGKLPDNYYNDSMNKRYHYIDNNFNDTINTKYHYIDEDFNHENETENSIPMIQSITEPYYYSDHVKDIIHIEHCINKCNTVKENIQNIIQYEQENERECPICFEELGDNNYIKTKCNHKTCVSCFVANIRLNNNTAKLCPLCREQMY